MHASTSPTAPGIRPTRAGGFSLLELIIVIAIIGLLAALTVPSLKNIQKSNALASTTQQLLDDVAMARRMAMKDRTTVLMVFIPPINQIAGPGALNGDEQSVLLRGQQTSYALFAERQVGDQPGVNHMRYLRAWRSLPDGYFIPDWKFDLDPSRTTVIGLTNATEQTDMTIYPFTRSSEPIPLPSTRSTRLINSTLPCIAFGPTGGLQIYNSTRGTYVDAAFNEYIPLARGSILLARDDADPKRLQWAPADISERAKNNSINEYNVVVIDRLTGRARIARQEILP